MSRTWNSDNSNSNRSPSNYSLVLGSALSTPPSSGYEYAEFMDDNTESDSNLPEEGSGFLNNRFRHERRRRHRHEPSELSEPDVTRGGNANAGPS